MADDEAPLARLEAVEDLFALGVDLDQREIEQALVTMRDAARQSLLNIASAAGMHDFAEASVDAIVEATLLLRR